MQLPMDTIGMPLNVENLKEVVPTTPALLVRTSSTQSVPETWSLVQSPLVLLYMCASMWMK